MLQIQNINNSFQKPVTEAKPVVSPRFSIKPSTIAKVASAVAIAALAGYAIFRARAAQPIATEKPPICTWSDAPRWDEAICKDPEIFKSTLTETEADVLRGAVWLEKLNEDSGGPCGAQEYFRFHPKDSRGKLLYLFSKGDTLRAPVLASFAKEYDVKVKEIHTLDEICREIDQASKRYLEAVVLHMDSTTPDSLSFRDGRKITTADSFECFSKIEPEGRILLMGPSPERYSTAGPNTINGTQHPNLAATIANQSGRTVIASRDKTAYDFMEWGRPSEWSGNVSEKGSIRPLHPSHPGGEFIRNCYLIWPQKDIEKLKPLFENTNAFREVKPIKV